MLPKNPLVNDTLRRVVLALLNSPRGSTYLMSELRMSGERLGEVVTVLGKGGFIAPRNGRTEPYALNEKGQELASLFVQLDLLTDQSIQSIVKLSGEKP